MLIKIETHPNLKYYNQYGNVCQVIFQFKKFSDLGCFASNENGISMLKEILNGQIDKLWMDISDTNKKEFRENLISHESTIKELFKNLRLFNRKWSISKKTRRHSAAIFSRLTDCCADSDSSTCSIPQPELLIFPERLVPDRFSQKGWHACGESEILKHPVIRDYVPVSYYVIRHFMRHPSHIMSFRV